MEGQNLHSNPVTQNTMTGLSFSLSLSYLLCLIYLVKILNFVYWNRIQRWVSFVSIICFWVFMDGINIQFAVRFAEKPCETKKMKFWIFLCPRKSEPPLIDVDLFVLWNIFVFSVFLAIKRRSVSIFKWSCTTGFSFSVLLFTFQMVSSFVYLLISYYLSYCLFQ